MRTVQICAGNWPDAPSHAPIVIRVLSDTSSDQKQTISHGQCRSCFTAIMEKLDQRERDNVRAG